MGREAARQATMIGYIDGFLLFTITATMDGPAGASVNQAKRNPRYTPTAPIRTAITAIASGVRASGRAAAAGMINMAVISKAPVTLIAAATTSASASVRARRSRARRRMP